MHSPQPAFRPRPADRQPIFNAPPGTVILCAVIVVAHFIRVLLPLSLQDALIERFAFVPAAFLAQFGADGDGLMTGELFSLVSYAFLHSTSDFMHLLFNMLLLYFFGTMLESILGSKRFLTLFLGAALCGALFHLLGEWILADPMRPVIGASGAVLGVLVAAAVLRPDTVVFLFFFPVRLRWLATGIVVIDAMNLLIELREGHAGIVAHHVHLGGALYGFMAARQGWVNWDPIERWRQRQRAGQQVRRQADQERLDGLLEKIHSEGLGSLSPEEKEFLRQVSRRG